jgi:hypothetical protein
LEIENYIEQITLLTNNTEETKKIGKILELKTLVQDPDITSMITDELRDNIWINETNTLIETCLKKTKKSSILQTHVQECKNFSVFKQIEEKLNKSKAVKIIKNNPWQFILIKENNIEIPWNTAKFNNSFLKSTVKEIILSTIDAEEPIITKEWLYKNQNYFFSSNIFRDTNFLMIKQ